MEGTSLNRVLAAAVAQYVGNPPSHVSGHSTTADEEGRPASVEMQALMRAFLALRSSRGAREHSLPRGQLDLARFLLAMLLADAKTSEPPGQVEAIYYELRQYLDLLLEESPGTSD